MKFRECWRWGGGMSSDQKIGKVRLAFDSFALWTKCIVTILSYPLIRMLSVLRRSRLKNENLEYYAKRSSPPPHHNVRTGRNAVHCPCSPLCCQLSRKVNLRTIHPCFLPSVSLGSEEESASTSYHFIVIR